MEDVTDNLVDLLRWILIFLFSLNFELVSLAYFDSDRRDGILNLIQLFIYFDGMQQAKQDPLSIENVIKVFCSSHLSSFSLFILVNYLY